MNEASQAERFDSGSHGVSANSNRLPAAPESVSRGEEEPGCDGDADQGVERAKDTPQFGRRCKVSVT